MTSEPDPLPLLRTLVGARVTRARRAWWVLFDEPMEREHGPLELTLDDGRVVLLDVWRDETLLEVSEQSFEHTRYGRLAIQPGATPRPDVGYVVEEETPALVGDRSALVESVTPVRIREIEPNASPSFTTEIVGVVIATEHSTVRAVTTTEGLLVVREPPAGADLANPEQR